MACWFIINSIQAACVGVDGDEAYYWMLSQHPDWGYFDHPPFVTLLMRMGESLGHGPFFTRLGTILLTTLTIGLVYAGLPARLQQVRNFLLLFAATLIFNVYSFIATPDAPLFFFAALYFLSYKRYLARASAGNVLLMALAVTGMFYSKYHGILPVLFTVLSNPRLLKKGSFWAMVALVTLFFLPHLYWQYQHNWPTVRFHLVERATHIYKIEYTTNYILGQLLIWGPLTSLLFYGSLLRLRKGDMLVRAHQFTFFGILLLFLLSSFKNSVQPHWTLVAGISFVVLFLGLLTDGTARYRKIFFRLAVVNIILIGIVRILFMLPSSPFVKVKNYKPFFEARAWADSVYRQAEGLPVIFPNSYAVPSLYRFYHPEAEAIGYNTKSYRKTHYNISGEEDKLQGKKVWIFREGSFADTARNVSAAFKQGSLFPVASYTAVNRLRIRPVDLPATGRAGEQWPVTIEITNTGRQAIPAEALLVDYSFSAYSYQYEESQEKYPLPDSLLAPGYTKRMTVAVTLPSRKGKYRLLFSFTNGSLQGNFASDYYPVKVE